MLLRPGNAGSNTFADHAAVLTAAIRQIPARMRSRLLVRVDGAGASHELITHLLSLVTSRRRVLFTCGWVLAASLAADLAAWCRLLGLYDCDDLKDAEPGTLRYRLLSLPARLVRHARARVLKISRTWPWKEAFLACWQRLCALPEPA